MHYQLSSEGLGAGVFGGGDQELGFVHAEFEVRRGNQIHKSGFGAEV